MGTDFEKIIEGIRAGLVLEMTYTSVDGEETIRAFVPVSLGSRNGQRYFRAQHLNGRSVSGANPGTFRLFILKGASNIQQNNGRMFGNNIQGLLPSDKFMTLQPIQRGLDPAVNVNVFNPTNAILYFNNKNNLDNIKRVFGK